MDQMRSGMTEPSKWEIDAGCAAITLLIASKASNRTRQHWSIAKTGHKCCNYLPLQPLATATTCHCNYLHNITGLMLGA